MSIHYRPDIDGLRAVAVLLVMFNHVGWSFFSGGYIGVDIFFVISGYLITSILLKEMQQQTFSIAQFYKKRVIRIAPAYFTVLLTVSVLSYFVLLPNELKQYSLSLIYSTFFMANIYMRKEVGDYFSNSVDETPLLHLWSLGVEEQFYIFWPLILLLLLRKIQLKWLGWIILALITLSIINAEYAIAKNAAKAYYKMPVRAFELLLGAIIYFLPTFDLKRFWTQLGIASGLVTIAICALFFDKNTHFPGLMALIPCLATALIVYLGQQDQKSNVVLNNPLSIYIGKLSYPMYLWHWPLIVLFNIYMWPLNMVNQLLIIGLTLILSSVTYHYIEIPCKRFAKASAKKVILIGFLLPACAVSSIAAFTIQKNGFPNRFSPEIQQQEAALQAFTHRIRKNCHNYPRPEHLPDPSNCILGKNKPEIDFLLIGDSHANHFTAMLDVWAKDANLRGFDVTQDTTPYLPGVEMFEKKITGFKLNETFKPRNDAITQHLKTHHYQFVVLAGSWNWYFEQMLQTAASRQPDQVYFQSIQTALNQIYASGAKAVLLIDTPNIKEMKANCSVRTAALGLQNTCHISSLKLQQQNLKFIQMLKRLKKEYPSLLVIDPTRVMCDKHVCQLAVNGVPLYRDKDNNHLNNQGSMELGREYLKYFSNPIKNISDR